MTGVVESQIASATKPSGKRQLTKNQMAAILVLSIIGAIVGTVAGLIVLTIIIGLAGGHT
jgi:hypothetical protein